MTVVLIVFAVLACTTLLALLAGSGAVVAWQRERQRSRAFAEQLMVEGRIEALTVQTLAAMRQAAREFHASRSDR